MLSCKEIVIYSALQWHIVLSCAGIMGMQTLCYALQIVTLCKHSCVCHHTAYGWPRVQLAYAGLLQASQEPRPAQIIIYYAYNIASTG